MKLQSIYVKSLYDYRRLAVLWTIGLFVLGIFYAEMYPSISGEEFTKAMANMSSDLITTFIGSAAFFSTPNGFIHGEFFTLTTPLILSIVAILIGSGVLAKEEEAGTLELLLARPTSRRSIVIQKALGVATVLVCLGVGIWLGLVVGRLLVESFTIDVGMMAIAATNLTLLALAFGMIALTITAVWGCRGLASSVAGVYFLFSYVVGTFGEQVSWLKHLEFLSLFHYFHTLEIFQNDTHWWHFGVLAGVIIVALAVSLVAFSRRDTGR